MRRRFPVLTAVSATAAVTATRLIGPGVVHALWRDPSALGSGQLWRLLSPVLVQSDPSVTTVIEVFLLCAVVGVAAEHTFSRWQWIALYLTGALVGHGIGEVFQPHQGGTSVAFAGLLGGLAASTLLSGNAVPLGPRIVAALAILAALADTVARDIHGLPFLAGLILAAVWLRRDRAPQGSAGAGRDVTGRRAPSPVPGLMELFEKPLITR